MQEQSKEDVRKLINEQIQKTKQKILDYEEMSSPVTPDDAIGRISRMDAISNDEKISSRFRVSYFFLRRRRKKEHSPKLRD